MKHVQLGGLTVSAEGLGCMGMRSVYGAADASLLRLGTDASS